MRAEEIEEALGLAEGELLVRLRNEEVRAGIQDNTLVRIVEVLRRHKPSELHTEQSDTELDLSGLPPGRAEELRRKLDSR